MHVYERGVKSRKLNGYHVYLRCAYNSWRDELSNAQKMDLIRPALRNIVIRRLQGSGFIAEDFNGDPFTIAPFTPDDFKGDMRTVVSYHWRNCSQEKKEAWKRRAERSNERPRSGEFSSFPRTLVQNDQNADGVLRTVLKKDYETTRQKFNKAFQRTTNPPSLYKKQEHILVDIPVEHKFYLNDRIPYTIFMSLFGRNLDIFYALENSKRKKRDTKTFHVMTRMCAKEILSFSDVDFSSHNTYKKFEARYELASFVIFQRVTNSTRIKGFGWRKITDDFILFRCNNEDKTGFIEIVCRTPKLKKIMTGETNRLGQEKFKYIYECENEQSVSNCGLYVLKEFCPIVIQSNQDKVSLKIVAPRACVTDQNHFFDTSLSSYS